MAKTGEEGFEKRLLLRLSDISFLRLAGTCVMNFKTNDLCRQLPVPQEARSKERDQISPSLRMSRRRFGALFCCFLGGSVFDGSTKAEVSNDLAADVAPTLEAFRAEGKIPGMVAVVLRGSNVIAQAAVGLRKDGSPEHVTLNDQFHLASCTKPMTATLAAMLVEEEKLSWITTLSEIFGETVKDMHPDWKNVTVQQILAHRAGFSPGNDPGLLLDAGLVSSKKSLPQQRQIVAAIQLSQQPETKPGTKWIYSNVGYIIVGAALEKISGRAWEDLMEERIFKPLGIITGGFGAPGMTGKVEQPWGHDEKGKPVDPGSPKSDNPKFFGPAGNVHMAITDWAKFIALHLRGDSANPYRHVSLLTPKGFEELHRARLGENYSAGWFNGIVNFAKGTRPGDKGIVLGQEGSNGLWYCKVLVAPEIDLAVLVACNRGGDAFGGKAVARTAVELGQRFGISLT
jgi:CubicO group peptidase (beta-lactamase class C family)